MKKYYYLNAQGQQMPPVDFESLRTAGINADTLVWFEGLPQWTRAGDIAELQSIVGAVPPAYGAQQPQPGYQQPQPGYPQPQPGYQQPPYQPAYQSPNPYNPGVAQKPQNFLWLGICTTLLCCLPLGIVSIVYSSKVDSYWNQGMYQQAQDSAEKAKMWGIASAAIGFVVCIVAFIAGALG